jgi:hypothetical protein
MGQEPRVSSRPDRTCRPRGRECPNQGRPSRIFLYLLKYKQRKRLRAYGLRGAYAQKPGHSRGLHTEKSESCASPGFAGRVDRGLSDARKTMPVAGYSIVLERNDDGVSNVYVAMGGEQLTKISDILRSPIPELAVVDADFHQKIDALIGFLKRKRNKHPVIVRMEGEDAEAEFDSALFPETFTELAQNGGEVTVIKGVRDQDLRILPFVLFGELIFIPDLNKLAVIEDTTGWEAWLTFDRELKKTGHEGGKTDPVRAVHFSIPLARFETMQHTCLAKVSTKGKKSILFTLHGNKAQPAPVALEPRMTIIQEENAGVAFMRAECTHGAFTGPIDFRRFRFFEDLNLLFSQYKHPKNNKEVLVQAFFDLMDAKTDAQTEKIIRTALDEGNIVKHEMRNSVRRLLQPHRSGRKTDDDQVFTSGGEWRIAHHNSEREALLYRISYEVFGWELFEHATTADTTSIPTALLHARLPLLCERFTKLGIDLFLKGKPVRQARWEFTMIATRKLNIDWFEIKPEIRCDGREDALSKDSGAGAKDRGRCIPDKNSFPSQDYRANGHTEASADLYFTPARR